MLSESDLYPNNTIVTLKRGPHSGKKAIIVGRQYQKDGHGFLNYYIMIEELPGKYAGHHHDLEKIDDQV